MNEMPLRTSRKWNSRSSASRVLLAGLGLALAGCSTHPVWVAGHTSDFSEVFEGQGTSDGAQEKYQISSVPGGVKCRGMSNNSFAAPQGRWTSAIECDDGRSSTFPMNLPAGANWFDPEAVWYGQASFPDGTSLMLVISSKTEMGIKDRLASFLQRQNDAAQRRTTEKRSTRLQSASPAKAPATTRGAPPPQGPGALVSGFPTQPVNIAFPKAPPGPDDVAVVIGNANYTKLGKDIPDVVPAYADAEGFKRYVTEALGVREGNVIDLRDATSARLVEVFGSETSPRGQLFDWVRPGRSSIYVYYAGHGAPGPDGRAYLVPVDANAQRIDLSGYPLDRLYRNLSQVPAKSAVVVLEACFSGASQAGSIISNASPVFMRPRQASSPLGMTIIAAGAADQIASWDEDKSHSLFTKYFLLGQSGEADKSPYGDGDGRVTLEELDRYLKDTLTYYARRYYGRDQTAQIVKGF